MNWKGCGSGRDLVWATNNMLTWRSWKTPDGQGRLKITRLTYLPTYSMKQNPSWEANRFSASQEIPRILWNPKVHYRIHKCPPSVPYTEPARSSPHLHITLPEDPSQYYPPIYAWVSQEVSVPQVSPPKPCTRLSSLPYMLHAPPISFFSIFSTEQNWLRGTDN